MLTKPLSLLEENSLHSIAVIEPLTKTSVHLPTEIIVIILLFSPIENLKLFKRSSVFYDPFKSIYHNQIYRRLHFLWYKVHWNIFDDFSIKTGIACHSLITIYFSWTIVKTSSTSATLHKSRSHVYYTITTWPD